jgi:hypothetical protein
MKTIEKRLYNVSARDCVCPRTSWDVDVLASSIREARRIGVAALEQKGLINRKLIYRTNVYESGTQVWTLQA